MLLELAKPVALVLCMISLLAVFHAAFLVPANDLEQRVWDSLMLVSLAAGICVGSGLLFREQTRDGEPSLVRTLPVQMFCWGVGVMVVMFFASLYLETHFIGFKDVHRF